MEFKSSQQLSKLIPTHETPSINWYQRLDSYIDNEFKDLEQNTYLNYMPSDLSKGFKNFGEQVSEGFSLRELNSLFSKLQTNIWEVLTSNKGTKVEETAPKAEYNSNKCALNTQLTGPKSSEREPRENELNLTFEDGQSEILPFKEDYYDGLSTEEGDEIYWISDTDFKNN